jgi:hypothetical protein
MLITVFSAGCVKYTGYKYETHVFPLDDRSELLISTFPSWFPETRKHIPFLYKRLQAPETVYFEFFVRATGTEAGHNPNIESIQIRNFSYEFPGQTPVVLIEDYSDGFWQQGQSDLGTEELEPVLCFEGWYILVKFDLILNGMAFKGEHTLNAQQVSRTYPLINDTLR